MMGKKYFILVLLVLALLVFTSAVYAEGENNVTEEITKESLNKLSVSLVNKMKEYQIPGLSVVVVKEDKVLMCRGFGWTDLEKSTPVTDTTVFSIGSSAKPFTGTLISVLVSDGSMGWDDPITKYLPYFHLKIKSDNPKDQVLIRDLLSHRTGFFHMSLIQKAINWEQDPDWDLKSDPIRYSREALLKAASEFEPQENFRLIHLYSNISMVAAAEASAKAVGIEWDILMKKRLFEPLGMTKTTTSITQIKDLQNVAKGYLLGEEGCLPVMAINMDVVSPAGGINSCARDMGNFMKLLLSGGVFNGKRLIKKSELEEMWTTQVQGADIGGLMPGASYGLGWFIRSWNGNKVVEHPGNALGYTANIALIPELGIGYVMLSNLMPTPILGEINVIVWEALGIQ
ncbi:MAG: beta-lactamase family protein [Candidatus Aminicenantes bacterium]|nr:beta-lactamase family protein [Candidatus Aminicenantes bacterium]